MENIEWFSLKGAWNHLRVCPSKTCSQSLPLWSCSINFSLLISMNCLSPDLLALLYHLRILKCNGNLFITTPCIYSLCFINGKLKKKQNRRERAWSTLDLSLPLWKCPHSSSDSKAKFCWFGHSLRASACNTVQWTPATQYNKQRNLADFYCSPFSDVFG